MKRVFFILIMLCFIVVFIVTDIYGQTQLKNPPVNTAPPKINENIPKEKPIPTVKSKEFRNINLIATQVSKSREFRNINLIATQVSKSREFRNINLIATQVSKSREFRNINLIATQVSKSREFRNINFVVTPFR